jgi:hypothetical protein
VPPLSDEDRRTLVRWVDLGCPIDLDFDPKDPSKRGRGWMLGDQRPTLTVAQPRAGANAALSRILVGMHDYGSGLDIASFTVTADFDIDGIARGENLASRFREVAEGVWEFAFRERGASLEAGVLSVSISDRQGNISRIERAFSISGTR